jgi:tight adherence protein C
MSLLFILALIACLAAAVALANVTDAYLQERQQRHQKDELVKRISEGTTDTKANSSKLSLFKDKPWLGFIRKVNKRSQSQNQLLIDNQLSMLLDITALGIRAGMAFDQAFELALRRSPGQLADICLAKLEIWQKGLVSRQQGMHELETEVQTVMFSRFVALVLRALRYGAPMTQLLNALSDETRRDIRARREEEVAKAPVKMLIPTGTLILPAMLLLVLGPILLDLVGKL